MNILNLIKNSIIRCLILLIVFCLAGCTSTVQKKAASNDDTKLTPVLFVTGLELGDKPVCEDYDYREWVAELHELFSEHGYELKVACIPPNGSIEYLALALYSEVNKLFYKPNMKFHIVAKSLGGLATRLMINRYKYKYFPDVARVIPISDRIISVTTIATPHKGSVIADNLMNGKRCTVMGNIIGEIYSYFSGGSSSGLKESGKALQIKNMREFNKNYPENNNIPFYSFGFGIVCESFSCNLFNNILKVNRYLPLAIPISYPSNILSDCWHDEILEKTGLDNDGLVSVDSTQWGKYLGTFEGEHIATTSNDFYFKYKFESIWKEVFEKVIVNLNSRHQNPGS